jgi:hypothetical protein
MEQIMSQISSAVGAAAIICLLVGGVGITYGAEHSSPQYSIITQMAYETDYSTSTLPGTNFTTTLVSSLSFVSSLIETTTTTSYGSTLSVLTLTQTSTATQTATNTLTRTATDTQTSTTTWRTTDTSVTTLTGPTITNTATVSSTITDTTTETATATSCPTTTLQNLIYLDESSSGAQQVNVCIGSASNTPIFFILQKSSVPAGVNYNIGFVTSGASEVDWGLRQFISPTSSTLVSNGVDATSGSFNVSWSPNNQYSNEWVLNLKCVTAPACSVSVNWNPA